MDYRILVAEDDRGLNQGIRLALQKEGVEFVFAYTLKDAKAAWLKAQPDMILLDVNFPDGNGFDFLRALRQTSDVPVLLITANDLESDEVTGLTLGADDYITKPFNPLELVARVKSHIRRYTRLGNLTQQNTENVYKCGGLLIHDDNKEVFVDGEPIKLTPIEYNILLLLVKNAGKVFSIDEIYEQIWNEEAIGADNTVAVHIRHIREKIEINPREPRYLKVVWGVGYKIEKQ